MSPVCPFSCTEPSENPAWGAGRLSFPPLGLPCPLAPHPLFINHTCPEFMAKTLNTEKRRKKTGQSDRGGACPWRALARPSLVKELLGVLFVRFVLFFNTSRAVPIYKRK